MSKKSELNPEHPVTAGLSDHWHKIAALLMHKFGYECVEITADEIDNLNDLNLSIVAESVDSKRMLIIRLLPTTEAVALAKSKGALLE